MDGKIIFYLYYCLMEFIITCEIWIANWSVSLKRFQFWSTLFLSKIYDHVSKCSFGPLLFECALLIHLLHIWTKSANSNNLKVDQNCN